MKKAIRWLVWLSLGLALCLAGCGTTSAKTADNPSSTATTALPTPTPIPTTAPTPDGSQLAACGLHSPSGVVNLGDLLVSGPGYTNVANPARKLPDGTPLAPFKLASGEALNTLLPLDPAVSPNMTAVSGGYWLSLCNSSPTTTHVVQGLRVRIESATP